MKSTFQPNKFHVISTSESRFMIEALKTAQNVKSLPEDLSCSIPVQDCTIIHCFMVHATHAWKAYQV